MMQLLVVTAVQAEADAIGAAVVEAGRTVVVSGIGRTNAAAATTEAILRHGPFDLVISAGVAGALPESPGSPGSPGSSLALGDVVLAKGCVYAEEGLETPEGFGDMAALGFSLGDFDGNIVPVDERALALLDAHFTVGRIATVATCSGANAAAQRVADRTGAVAEAMEGAAVVHAARRLQTRAIEVRAISNTTGDRDAQQWNLAGALVSLGRAMRQIIRTLQADHD